MEAELAAAGLMMKEAVFCKSIMQELGFKGGFDSVPLFIDSTLALHVAGNRIYSPRATFTELRYFFIQELVEDVTVTIHHVKMQDQLADISKRNVTGN